MATSVDGLEMREVSFPLWQAVVLAHVDEWTREADDSVCGTTWDEDGDVTSRADMTSWPYRFYLRCDVVPWEFAHRVSPVSRGATGLQCRVVLVEAVSGPPGTDGCAPPGPDPTGSKTLATFLETLRTDGRWERLWGNYFSREQWKDAQADFDLRTSTL